MGDAKAPARIGLAVQQHAHPGRVALHEPRLVEERRTHRPGRVEHGRLDERAHPAPTHRPRADRADLDRHGRLLAGAQAGDRARLAAVAGQVLEQLADGAHGERAQPVGELAARQR